LCSGFQKERRILELERLMTAAVDLHFEDAAELRDEIEKLKNQTNARFRFAADIYSRPNGGTPATH